MLCFLRFLPLKDFWKLLFSQNFPIDSASEHTFTHHCTLWEFPHLLVEHVLVDSIGLSDLDVNFHMNLKKCQVSGVSASSSSLFFSFPPLPLLLLSLFCLEYPSYALRPYWNSAISSKTFSNSLQPHLILSFWIFPTASWTPLKRLLLDGCHPFLAPAAHPPPQT